MTAGESVVVEVEGVDDDGGGDDVSTLQRQVTKASWQGTSTAVV
jgi:hypothetical protein